MTARDVLHDTAWILSPSTTPGALVYAVLFVAAATLLGRFLRLAVDRLQSRPALHLIDPTAAVFLKQLGVTVVYVVALVLYAHLIPSLRALGTALLTGVSVVSLVIGLAAQATLGNVIAGVSMLLYRPFRVGDRLQFNLPTGAETGVVERLTLGYTVLLSDAEHRVIVPNSTMASQPFVNMTAVDRRTLASIDVAVPAGLPIDRAVEVLGTLVRQHKLAHEGRVTVRAVPPGQGPVLSVRAWCANATAPRQLEADLAAQAPAALAAAGLREPAELAKR